MGNTLTGEYPSTWNDSGVKRWKEEARNLQTCIHLQYEGSQFHDITELSHELRITKICFAIYCQPTEEAEDLETAYSKKQREVARKIYKKINEVWTCAPEKRFLLGVLFILCKEEDNTAEKNKGNGKEYQVPLFRLLWERKEKAGGGYTVTDRFIDTSLRVYDSSEDWMINNKMPMMKYCYPRSLIYKSDSTEEFCPDEEPELCFDTSPACQFKARVLRSTDAVATMGVTISSLTSNPIGVFSRLILFGVAESSKAYGLERTIFRLQDEGFHGESISELESVLLFLSITASPLNVLSGLANAQSTAGSASGRIFSKTERIVATLLTFSALGVDSFALFLHLGNLIDKYIEHKLLPLDVLQFGITTFFFRNTLIQPKTAYSVIKIAEQKRIDAISESMSDETAKNAFKAFLEQNKDSCRIGETSNFLRGLNKMEDPIVFLNTREKEVTNKDREGNTVTINSDNCEELTDCLDVDYTNHKYLKNMTEQQRTRFNKVFGGSAKYNVRIVDCATNLANRMEIPANPDQFISLGEIIADKTKQDPNFALDNLQSDLTENLERVRLIAIENNVKFADELKALYLYRKHGEEFMSRCTSQFYLKDIPNSMLQNGRLPEVDTVITPTSTDTTETLTEFSDNNVSLPADSFFKLAEISEMPDNNDPFSEI